MEKLLKFLGAALVIVAVDLLLSLPIMWLWNWLAPVIFGLTKITFWQALGLNVLVTLLFYKPNSNN